MQRQLQSTLAQDPAISEESWRALESSMPGSPNSKLIADALAGLMTHSSRILEESEGAVPQGPPSFLT